jgi:hypothetical protein
MRSSLARLRHLTRNLSRRGHVEADLDAEVRAHLELLVAQRVADGMGEPEAQRAARVELGGAEQVKDAVRDVRMGAWHGAQLRRNSRPSSPIRSRASLVWSPARRVD